MSKPEHIFKIPESVAVGFKKMGVGVQDYLEYADELTDEMQIPKNQLSVPDDYKFRTIVPIGAREERLLRDVMVYDFGYDIKGAHTRYEDWYALSKPRFNHCEQVSFPCDHRIGTAHLAWAFDAAFKEPPRRSTLVVAKGLHESMIIHNQIKEPVRKKHPGCRLMTTEEIRRNAPKDTSIRVSAAYAIVKATYKHEDVWFSDSPLQLYTDVTDNLIETRSVRLSNATVEILKELSPDVVDYQDGFYIGDLLQRPINNLLKGNFYTMTLARPSWEGMNDFNMYPVTMLKTRWDKLLVKARRCNNVDATTEDWYNTFFDDLVWTITRRRGQWF